MNYWERPVLKQRAKMVLSKSYWTSFLVMFICGLVGGGASGVNLNFSIDRADIESIQNIDNLDQIMSRLAPFIVPAAITASIFSIALNIFVGNLFEIGKCRFFSLCRYDRIEVGEILFGFKNGYYWENLKTMFLRNLYIWLWSLLLVVPGIVKSYSYFMVPYIKAENPMISTERAFDISKRATWGEKWEMFVMDLSFIGWYLLGAFACGVGVMFVNPYHEATKAELYGALRYKAVMTGVCTKEEIGAEL